MRIFGNSTENLAKGNLNTSFESDFIVSVNMGNIKISSQNHALRSAAWLLYEISWFQLAINTSHIFEAPTKPESKSYHIISPFVS